MLKAILFSLATFTGQFSGHGHWKSPNGQTGDYTVQTQIENGTWTNTYDFAGQAATFVMQAPLDQAGFFPVKVNGQTVGSGFCFEIQCHYRIKMGNFKLEETMTFYQGHLYRLGSKSDGSRSVSWQEDMVRQ